MSIKKSVTIKVTDDEIAYYKSITDKYGIDRTEMIKRGIRSFVESQGDNPLRVRVQEIAKDSISITDYTHPLLETVRKEGIVVRDDDNNKVATIKNLTQLLDFVNSKVFYNEGS